MFLHYSFCQLYVMDLCILDLYVMELSIMSVTGLNHLLVDVSVDLIMHR